MLKFPLLFFFTKNAKFYELINVDCKGQNACCQHVLLFLWLFFFWRHYLQKERNEKSLTRIWMHLKPLLQDMSDFWMNTVKKCELKIKIFHFMRSLKSLEICGASYHLSKSRYLWLAVSKQFIKRTPLHYTCELVTCKIGGFLSSEYSNFQLQSIYSTTVIQNCL